MLFFFFRYIFVIVFLKKLKIFFIIILNLHHPFPLNYIFFYNIKKFLFVFLLTKYFILQNNLFTIIILQNSTLISRISVKNYFLYNIILQTNQKYYQNKNLS